MSYSSALVSFGSKEPTSLWVLNRLLSDMFKFESLGNPWARQVGSSLGSFGPNRSLAARGDAPHTPQHEFVLAVVNQRLRSIECLGLKFNPA